jgi:hypothetical protein
MKIKLTLGKDFFSNEINDPVGELTQSGLKVLRINPTLKSIQS